MNAICTSNCAAGRFRIVEGVAAAMLLAACYLCGQSAADAGTIFSAQNVMPGTIFAISPSGAKASYVSVNNTVVSMATDPAGDLFYAESIGAGVISKRTPAGALTVFATSIGASVHGMACDASGALYVAVDSSILKYSPTGARSVFATDNNNPAWLGFEPDGSLIVLDSAAQFSQIKKFNSSGIGSVFASNILNPRAFAMDKTGNIFIEATNGQGGQEIFKYSPTGVKTHFADPPGWPWGLTVDPTNDRLYGSFGSNANFTDPNASIYSFDSIGNATMVSKVPHATNLAASSVPEPGGLALALGGAMSAALARRRSTRKGLSSGMEPVPTATRESLSY